MSYLTENLPIMWLAVAVILLVTEAATVNLITLWFGIGALISMVATLLGVNLWWSVIIFMIATALMLVYTRPLAEKVLKKTPTNADRLIGMTAVVTQAIDDIKGTGQVVVQGVVWSAKSADNKPIPEGTEVTIIKIQGVKLLVE